MFVEAILLAWSGLALLWWIVAWTLVRAGTGDPPASGPASPDSTTPFLSIFKPLAPLGERSFNPRGIASFLAQMGEHEEVLLGAHEADRLRLKPALASWRAQFPQAQLVVVWRAEPDAVANPKIAWLQRLAPRARGELWLWSDADIVAPPGFLRAARAEYAAAGAKLLTWPYAVRETSCRPALLDALFVNAEFLPGVLLLRRLGPVDFGLGAGLLFARADFLVRTNWAELGCALADDFVLGRRLRPVHIGRAILDTEAGQRTWRKAIRHYLRWSKTVRWNRPGGTAARIVVLPVLGWLALIMARPDSVIGWLGLAAMMQIDALAAAWLCRRLGCGLTLGALPVLQLWSLGRALVWVACWLPWPVIWCGRRWRGPFAGPGGRPFDKA